MNVWEMMDKASALKNSGKTQEALEGYNDAFNALIDEAGKYAVKMEEGMSKEELRANTGTVFAHSKEYLQRDLTAAIILNEMGMLFMEQAEYANAEQKFIESIEFIPEGEDFADPADNLEQLAILVTAQQPEETSYEE